MSDLLVSNNKKACRPCFLMFHLVSHCPFSDCESVNRSMFWASADRRWCNAALGLYAKINVCYQQTVNQCLPKNRQALLKFCAFLKDPFGCHSLGLKVCLLLTQGPFQQLFSILSQAAALTLKCGLFEPEGEIVARWNEGQKVNSRLFSLSNDYIITWGFNLWLLRLLLILGFD